MLVLFNFTSGGDPPRLRKLVEEGCIPRVVRALPTLEDSPASKKRAVVILDRLSQVAAPEDIAALVNTSVLEALVEVHNSHKDSDDKVTEACRDFLNVLLNAD